MHAPARHVVLSPSGIPRGSTLPNPGVKPRPRCPESLGLTERQLPTYQLCVRSETEAPEAAGRPDPQGRMHLIPSWAKAVLPTGGVCGERCCPRGSRHRTNASSWEYKFIHTKYPTCGIAPTTPSVYKHWADLSHPSMPVNVIRTNNSRSFQVLFPPFTRLALTCRGTPFPWGRDSGVWQSAMS